MKILIGIVLLGLALAQPAQSTTVYGDIYGQYGGANDADVRLKSGDETVTTILSNDSGQYRFEDVEPGTYTIEVDYDSSTSISSEIVTTQDTRFVKRDIWIVPSVDIDIPTYYDVTGIVSDYMDTQYENVEVAFTSYDTGTKHVATTAADGTYSLQLPESTYAVSVVFRGFSPDYPSTEILYSAQQGYFEVTDSGDDSLDILMPFKEVNVDATLNGEEVSAEIIIDQNISVLNPITNGYDYGYVSVTNENTTNNTLLPVAESISAVLIPSNRSDNGPFPSVVNISGLTADSELEQISHPLNALGVVLEIDQVTDLDGNDLGDVCVRARSTSVESLNFSNCQFGEDKLYLLPGNYAINLSVRSPEWDPETNDDPIYYSFRDVDSLSLALVNNQTTTVNRSFTMPIRQVDVEVTDSDGQAVSGAQVVLQDAFGEIRYDASRYGTASIFGSKATTDSMGVASLYVSPLLGTLLVEPSDSQNLASQLVAVSSLNTEQLVEVTLGEATDDVVDINGDFVVYGKIENAAGTSFNGVLYSTDVNGNAIEAQVVDGNYAADFKGQGDYTLGFAIEPDYSSDFIVGAQYFSYSKDIRVDATYRKDLVIPFSGVQGKVMTSSGANVQGLTASVTSEFTETGTRMSTRISGLSDSDGTFYFSRLPYRNSLTLGAISLSLNNYYSFSTDYSDVNQSLDIILVTNDEIELRDSDADGIPDYYETRYGDLNPNSDEDNDSLSNLAESKLGTDPLKEDTDSDGLADSEDPFPLLQRFAHIGDLSFDGDNDGYSHMQEVIIGTDPNDTLSVPELISSLSFSSVELESCVENSLYDPRIRYVNQVESIDCSYGQLTSLDGLEAFFNLRYLQAYNNNISDISAITELTSLINLNLGDNAISDLTSISGLPFLRDLELNSNRIVDLSGLSDLPSLSFLGLSNNNIQDLSPLRSLELPNYLDISLANNNLTCTSETYFNSLSDIPILCLEPDLLEERGRTTVIDFEAAELDSLIEFSSVEWTRVDSGFESGFSLQSGVIFDGETTSFSITTETPAGVVSFDYFIESEQCCDFASFTIDGETVEFYGEYDPQWKQYVAYLDAGEHTFEWQFRKDGSVSSGIDAVRIDNIIIPSYFDERVSVMPLGDEQQSTISRLGFDSELNQFSFWEESLDQQTVFSQVNWPVEYENVHLHLLTQNESTNLGLFGIRTDEGFEGRSQMFVRSSSTGARVNVYNWPANWSNVESKILPDLNGDGVKEVAIQGSFKDGNRPQLVVKNGADASNLRTFQFPDLWDNPQYMAFSDVTNDGVPEIALFGTIKRNGKPQVKIIDGTNPANRLKAFTFPNNWENVSWNRLSDSNGDGEDDWGLFGRRIDDGRSQLIVKDARNPRGALRIYAWTSGFDSASFYSIPDMDGDDIDEVAAGGYRSDIDRYQITVKNGADRNAVLANYGWPNIWTDVSLRVLADMTGDGLSEVTLFGKNNNGNYQVAIKHGVANQGELLRHELDGNWDAKPSIHLINDTDGDGLSDILFIGKNLEKETRTFILSSELLN